MYSVTSLLCSRHPDAERSEAEGSQARCCSYLKILRRLRAAQDDARVQAHSKVTICDLALRAEGRYFHKCGGLFSCCSSSPPPTRPTGPSIRCCTLFASACRPSLTVI